MIGNWGAIGGSLQDDGDAWDDWRMISDDWGGFGWDEGRLVGMECWNGLHS